MGNDNFSDRTDEWFKANLLADFSKRRFARTLRQERPRNEQDDAGYALHVEELIRMLTSRCPNFSLWNLSGGHRMAGVKVERGILLAGFNLSQGHTAEISMMAAAVVRYKIRKFHPEANDNPISRFMRPQ